MPRRHSWRRSLSVGGHPCLPSAMGKPGHLDAQQPICLSQKTVRKRPLFESPIGGGCKVPSTGAKRRLFKHQSPERKRRVKQVEQQMVEQQSDNKWSNNRATTNAEPERSDGSKGEAIDTNMPQHKSREATPRKLSNVAESATAQLAKAVQPSSVASTPRPASKRQCGNSSSRGSNWTTSGARYPACRVCYA